MSENKKRILIVDDDADLRMLLELTLKKAGFEVIKAPNGAKALEIIREQTPKLIITDALMPVLDGYGLIKAVREKPTLSIIPIIMLTGKESQQEAADNIRPDAYIKKPFAPSALIAEINALLP